jgi:uncharacterized protein (TIGR02466 family)
MSAKPFVVEAAIGRYPPGLNEQGQATRTAWEAIFPTPILRTNIGREFTERELDYVRRTQQSTCLNVANSRSVDTRVLDAEEMQPLRSIIEPHVEDFCRKTVTASRKVQFFITQSWINYTRKGQSHHRHCHTNSLASGVLYLSARKEVDRISFFRPPATGIAVDNEVRNWYTADSWSFDVGAGDLLLFPSSLVHGVDQTVGEHLRVSLSFNTFVRGELGSDDRLNGLRLDVS